MNIKIFKVRTMLFIFLICALNFISEKALAQCGLSITANNINVVWDPTFVMQSVSLTLSKTNPAACTFGLTFTKGGSANYTRYGTAAALQLKYQLYQDVGGTKILKHIPDIVSVNDVIMVTLPAGSGPQLVQYFFDIPYVTATTPVLAHSGTYVDNFIISAYEGVDPTLFADPAATSAAVALTMTVDKSIKLSFVDLGLMFQEGATTKAINFGKLNTGAISRFNMAVQTNAGFSVTFSSANAGNLKHVATASLVPYTATVNAVPADLTGVVPVIAGAGQTALTGLVYPVVITIGAVGVLAVSGDYQDVITVTATVTE